MSQTTSRRRKKAPKRILALPDLEQVKLAVLSSLTSKSGRRTYDHAIREFVMWYGKQGVGVLLRQVDVLHLYREGYGDRWAMPLPAERFSDAGDPWLLLLEFMQFVNVTMPPDIRRGLFT